LLAVANYHETYGCFPPAYVTDRDGKPIHSWRVLILPFLEQQELYSAYNFAERWNGPNNRNLTSRVGSIYLRSGLESDQIHTTSFVAVVGPQTAVRTGDMGNTRSGTWVTVSWFIRMKSGACRN
jgi:Protein of unknown function (DUF1559)